MKKLLTLLLALAMLLSMAAVAEAPDTSVESADEIGRASCRERV